MEVYKIINSFSETSGKPDGKKRIFSHEICDFTGEEINEYTNPNSYDVNYNNNDPNFGDGEGEEWLYDWITKNDIDVDSYDLFGQSNYIFRMKKNSEYIEVFEELMKKAIEELDEIYSLDHLLRWSRGKMLEKIIKEGTYTINQLIEID